MNVNDIPQELYSKIQLSFDSNRDVMLLRTARQNAQRSGDFGKALKIAQDIENLWVICLDNYMKKAEKESDVFDTETADIPVKDKDDMLQSVMVMFMACDIIESAAIDMNDVLHKTNPNTNFTLFDDIKQALGLAQEKLKYFNKNGEYMKDLAWADACDNMYEMMQSKAKSVIRKRKESKNWGENMKKLEKGEDYEQNQ